MPPALNDPLPGEPKLPAGVTGSKAAGATAGLEKLTEPPGGPTVLVGTPKESAGELKVAAVTGGAEVTGSKVPGASGELKPTDPAGAPARPGGPAWPCASRTDAAWAAGAGALGSKGPRRSWR